MYNFQIDAVVRTRRMKLFCLFLLFILVCTDIAATKKIKQKKRQRNKFVTNKQMTQIEKQIKELKKQASLPRNIVNLHMHDGNAETVNDEHQQRENEQHIHMHMHTKGIGCQQNAGKLEHHEEIRAHCEIETNSNIKDGENITGQIHMIQKGDRPVHIFITLSGFDVRKETAQFSHGFHIHTFGDMKDSCDSLGPHFNPKRTKHAGKDDKTRHVGDLGNIDCDMNGDVNVNMTDNRISLHGTDSIIGRSIVIHANPDDMGRGGNTGSETSGNAGTRIACCSIARSNPELHQQYTLPADEKKSTESSEESLDDDR